jgi:cytochrome c oxidase assembly protein Cox11
MIVMNIICPKTIINVIHHSSFITLKTREIIIDKKVGIDYTQEDAQLPYRFIWQS